MNEHLAQLVNLSKIDKTIDAFEPQIESATAKVSDVRNNKERIEAITNNLKSDIEESELKKRKNELHLAELSDKLKANATKSGEVKNEREMKSLQLEEEIAKEQITFANEEISRLDSLIENRRAEIEKESGELEDLTSKEAALTKEVEAEIKTIEEARQLIFADKQKLVSSMNQKGLAYYEKIRRWAKNTTAVPVKKQACYGCFMKVSDKVYADVIKGEDIINCPHCGRILYIEPETGETSAA